MTVPPSPKVVAARARHAAQKLRDVGSAVSARMVDAAADEIERLDAELRAARAQLQRDEATGMEYRGG